MSVEAEQVHQEAAAPPTAVENVTTAVAKFDRVAAGLAELTTRYSAVLFDVGTTKGMKEATAARAAIRGPRVDVEKVRKECKAPILALGRDIDTRAAEITAKLLALEEPIDKQIKAEETRKEEEKARKAAAEVARITALNQRLQAMRDLVPACVGQSAAGILEQIRALVQTPIDATFQEFEEQAGQVNLQVLGKLRDLHAAQVAHEAEQERLRLEREELERQRLAQQQSQRAQDEANRKERERIAAEEAEAKRKRELADAEALAKREAHEAERQRQYDEAMTKIRADRVQRDREEAERAERQRGEDEQRAAEHRRQQAALEAEQELQQARWGEINAMGHQVMIATTGRLGVRVGGTLECIVATLAETEQWQVTEEKFGPLYPVALSARQTACDAITRELQAWDARAEAERIAAEQAEAHAGVASATELTEADTVAEVSTTEAEPAPAIEFVPTANDITDLVMVVFSQAELAFMAKSPEALEALIDWHDFQESCADGMDMPGSAEHHRARRLELTAVHAAAVAQRQKEIDG